ncbi:WD40-repeat-containing domain protein [Scheffersomyces xylosifermentans]|uniref:WD40-repeat-containing domain protein n=1 Tax=Scheffersomyces xylosifermentans TaxID=1304137 RepID=UPI00315CE539
MDWYNNRSKRSSISTGAPSFSPPSYGILSGNASANSSYNGSQRSQFFSAGSSNSTNIGNSLSSSSSMNSSTNPLLHNSSTTINSMSPNGSNNIPSSINNTNSTNSNISNSPSLTTPIDRNSYYFSQYPLYCSDWSYLPTSDTECIALSSYKEGFTNKLQVVHGLNYESEYTRSKSYEVNDDITMDKSSPTTPAPQHQYLYQAPPSGTPTTSSNSINQPYSFDDEIVEGFYFHKAAEIGVDYPVTNLQWDPLLSGNTNEERLAASSEVLRLYKVEHDPFDQNGDYRLIQTHTLANNTTSTTSSTSSNGTSGKSIQDDINTFPPVTSFDWNKIDPNILITSSVDTTCTVWDLHRSHNLKHHEDGTGVDTATVKTQLIAHDSEVFDVKFIHNSTNIFASVGNDGSMRVFDLRSLEHSTIIYEPTVPPPQSPTLATANAMSASALHSRALLKLSTSHIDQHHLATIGINSNQVIIIDMRVPGLPVATLDGSFGGRNAAAINSISWHPTSNYLLTGGDDCQALVWDCNKMHQLKGASSHGISGSSATGSSDVGVLIETPVLAYEEDLEVNNVCWRGDSGDWMGVVSGKGFQAVQI